MTEQKMVEKRNKPPSNKETFENLRKSLKDHNTGPQIGEGRTWTDQFNKSSQFDRALFELLKSQRMAEDLLDYGEKELIEQEQRIKKLRQVSELGAFYDKTGNPLFVWKAYSNLRSLGLDLLLWDDNAKWILNYFDQAVKLLVGSLNTGEDKGLRDESFVGEAFLVGKTRIFKEYRTEIKNLHIYREVVQAVEQVNSGALKLRPRESVFDIIGAKYSLSYKRTNTIFNETKKIIDIFLEKQNSHEL